MTDTERDKLIRETHDTVVSMHGMVRDHHATLYGNGQPGVVKTLTRVESRQENCPALLNSKRDNRGFWIGLGGLIIAALTLISALMIGE